MHIHLKVKLKSLAAEARIIRKEEKRALTSEVRADLHEHRVGVVRQACRSTHLAYGFLRGRPYEAMERTSYSFPNWKEVERMVTRYSEGDPRHSAQKFSEWKAGAVDYKETGGHDGSVT